MRTACRSGRTVHWQEEARRGVSRISNSPPRRPEAAGLNEGDQEDAECRKCEVGEEDEVGCPEVYAAQKNEIVDKKACDEAKGGNVVHVPLRKLLDISGEFDESGSRHPRTLTLPLCM